MKKDSLPLSVRRDCNLDLRLRPSGYLPLPDSGSEFMYDGSKGSPQQLTIFYNGRVCVCDVTELQARAIIWVAKREMDERMNSPQSDPASPLQSQLRSPTSLSMKRSLQQFLQKRKTRIQAISPYRR